MDLHEDYQGMEADHAGFGIRFMALMIDAIVLALLNGIITSVFGDGIFHFDFMTNVATTLVGMGYFVYFQSSDWQATPGKRILGLQVVDQSYQKISPAKAIVRFLSRIISNILLLGYIWVIFDDDKQSWHDKIASTYVVYA